VKSRLAVALGDTVEELKREVAQLKGTLVRAPIGAPPPQAPPPLCGTSESSAAEERRGLREEVAQGREQQQQLGRGGSARQHSSADMTLLVQQLIGEFGVRLQV
jgi:hypothetical protein